MTSEYLSKSSLVTLSSFEPITVEGRFGLAREETRARGVGRSLCLVTHYNS